MKHFFLIATVAALFRADTLTAQLASCDGSVPYRFVDLSGDPAGTWISPSHPRQGNCCGTVAPDRCTSFEVILDTQAVALSFDIFSGAIPTGSMFYQIDCGAPTPVGELICISGPGPHRLTFCKPGNNENRYLIRSISRPIFPDDDSTRSGCTKRLEVLGLDDSTITWTTVAPGDLGDYSHLLSCTQFCQVTYLTPDVATPPFIDILVCGFPEADECGYVLTVCDTFRVSIFDSLSAQILPDPATFCQTGPGSGVMITAEGAAGSGAYTYTWRDSTGNVMETAAGLFATYRGNFTVEVNDGLGDDLCYTAFATIPVMEGLPPVVNAGPDQVRCATDPQVILEGSVVFATGGVWRGGAGTFLPDSTVLLASYLPTSGEIAAGSISLCLVSTGAGGSCTEGRDTVVIFFSDTIRISLADTTLLCSSYAATMQPGVAGGQPPFNYLWTTASTESSIAVGAGNYCLTVSDQAGCSATVCANVVAPAALSLTLSGTDASADGAADGTATASAGGGTPPYSYNWSNGGTASALTGLTYGIYQVTVTDDSGCNRKGSVVVNEPRCLSFSTTMAGEDLTCHNDLSGSAFVTASGGTSPYSYTWNNGPAQTTDTIAGLNAGVYAVTVYDSNGCLDVNTVTLLSPPPLANIINTTDVSKLGENDGAADANPSGGSIPYSYSWSNGQSGKTLDSLPAGVYVLLITDANGCTLVDSARINEPPCNNLRIYLTTSGLACYGDNDGAAQVHMIGGTPPYNVLWSNGNTGDFVSDLSPGSYTVQVTDSFNCQSFQPITVPGPAELSTGIAGTDISCFGLKNGSADLTVSGGTYPYQYNWSNGVAAEDQIRLGPGKYIITVTDINGCSAEDSVNISQNPPLEVTHSATDVTCFGGSNGTINLTAGGGQAPYVFLWSDGASGEDRVSISSGLYVVTVSDANGCTNENVVSVLVDEPARLVLDSFMVQCPSPGAAVSGVTVYASGGTGPYQVSFDSGATYLAIGDMDTLLTAGETYRVLVRDANSCSDTAAAGLLFINAPVTIDSISYGNCYYGTDSTANVTISISGGRGPYLVSVDSGFSYGPPGEYLKSLPVGTLYSVMVRDELSCESAVKEFYVPARFSVAHTIQTYEGGYHVRCGGSTDGSISVSASGATPPYTYLWSSAATTSIISGIPAGTYRVTISDAGGCAISDSAVVTEPETLAAQLMVSSSYAGRDISCYGAADGSLDLAVTGGTPGYTFAWSHGTTTEDPAGLTAGNYVVTIMDRNGCSAVATQVIGQPDSLSFLPASTDATCFGYSNGSINLAVTGATPPYVYLWSTGNTSEDIAGFPAGIYQVAVTDLNGCSSVISVTIGQDPLLELSSFSIPASCYGFDDGNADLTVSGGVSPYVFLWSDGNTSEDLGSVPAGIFGVTVTDDHVCSATGNISVSQPDALTGSIRADRKFNGHHITYHGGRDGIIHTDVSGGIPPYLYQWSGGTLQWPNGTSSPDLPDAGVGAYIVTVTDVNGCELVMSLALTEPLALELPTGFSPNGDGRNDRFEIHGLEAYPDNKFTVFNRWGNVVYEKQDYANTWNGENMLGSFLSDGTYFVILHIYDGEIRLNGYVDLRTQ